MFARLLVCARLGVAGQCGPAAPAPALLDWLVLTPWCGRAGVCRVWAASMGGTWLSRPYSVALSPLRGVWGERGEGEPPAGRLLAWAGAGCVSGASALMAHTTHWWREREVGIGPLLCVGRVGLASVRALIGLGGAGLRVSPFGGGCVSGGDDFPR